MPSLSRLTGLDRLALAAGTAVSLILLAGAAVVAREALRDYLPYMPDSGYLYDLVSRSALLTGAVAMLCVAVLILWVTGCSVAQRRSEKETVTINERDKR